MSSEDKLTEAGMVSADEREGRELLTELASVRKDDFLNSDQMREILQKQINGTRFAGATIEEVTDGVSDVCRYMEAKVKDVQGRETYHIWFARKDGKWILKYCEIPQT